MKKYILFLLASFLISTAFQVQVVNGQDKSKADIEKEAKIQKSIDEQKKAMADQKKAQKEIEKEQEKQETEMEWSMDEANEQLENADMERAKIFMRMPRNRSFNTGEPFITIEDGGDWSMFGHMGDSERTTFDFSKSVKDNTFSRDYIFDVDKSSKSVVMSVNGDCKSGEIRIKIIMPNGKSYSDILIDESGNLNWRKSFTITETENKDKTGDWKFLISSTKATGYFKISLQTY
jgi:ATPase subunit of ABC transporter with duplicated ATPase domains